MNLDIDGVIEFIYFFVVVNWPYDVTCIRPVRGVLSQ